MNRIKYALLIPLLFFGTCLQAQQYGTLEITFMGIRNNLGDMALGIYNPGDDWPDGPSIEPSWNKKGLKDGTMVVRVDSLEYGTYAAIVLDDENKDREMRMVMGIPREGFAFSNNPKMRLSAPRYEDCSFVLNRPVHRIVMEIKYY